MEARQHRGGAAADWLLCSVGDRWVALPLSRVVETMRPLPVRSLPGLPGFVPGVCVIRDAVVPVVRVAALVGGPPTVPGRFVTVAVDGRTVALAVDAVVGIRPLDPAGDGDVPPLLRALEPDVVAAVRTLDPMLLLVLEVSRLVPAGVWAVLDDDPAVVPRPEPAWP